MTLLKLVSLALILVSIVEVAIALGFSFSPLLLTTICVGLISMAVAYVGVIALYAIRFFLNNRKINA